MDAEPDGWAWTKRAVCTLLMSSSIAVVSCGEADGHLTFLLRRRRPKGGCAASSASSLACGSHREGGDLPLLLLHRKAKKDRMVVGLGLCGSSNRTLLRQLPVDVVCAAEYILVVEKESVFQRLANDGFCRKNHCVVITGRGYPDVSTRRFLRYLVGKLCLPVYCLVDCDPYGLDILMIYRFGSMGGTGEDATEGREV